MRLRRATMDDALDVLAWRNDPHTRAMSREGGLLGPDAHLAWFEQVLADPQKLLFVAESDGRKVGMARFDDLGGAWEVSINLAPAERGRGFGRALLDAALAELFQAVGSTPVIAEIKPVNTGSVRIFEAAGFLRLDTEAVEYLRYRYAADPRA
jgi:RimJ/RimL family protein N-acetyltransferase